MVTFGEVLSTARKRAGLSQKQVAQEVRKDDGVPISPQYLNDLEHDRRNPPSEALLRQLAKRLDLSVDYLVFLAGELPEELRRTAASPEQVERAFSAFRTALREKR